MCKSATRYLVPLLFIFGFVTIVFFSGGCASTGYPAGGPRDEDPPYMVRSFPPESSLSFTGDEIRIEFNELIEVSDIFQKLMVSPPVNEQPVVTSRGNAILVEFQEDLQTNTTYTIDFADAIRDVNEGNVLQDFRFSFSTGEIMDSLQISGHLFDAADLSPVAGALVMVHVNHSDSAFKKMVPVRVTKTNPQGRFSIQNLAPGEYRLYALEDANRNFRYDQPGERIAFYPELVSPYIGTHQRIDSISQDSAVIIYEEAYLPDSLKLFLFKEQPTNQYLIDYERKTRNRINFFFNLPLEQPLNIELVNKELSDWYIYEHSFQHDSITLWLTDSLLIRGDSLMMSLRYPILDSLQEVTIKTDTINAYYFETGRAEPTRRRGEETPEMVPVLRPEGLKANIEILEQLRLRFPTPIKHLRSEKIRMYEMQDTIPKPIDFDIVQDTIRLRDYTFDFTRTPGDHYLLKADSAAFTDIYGLTTDSIHQGFSVRTEENYGVFYIELEEPRPTWLIQILTRQEQVVRQAPVPASGRIAFRYLRPGDYFIRIVDDVNRNGKWDVGDFEKGIQPESLYYFPETINIRANWERHILWNPHEFDIYDFVRRHRERSGTQRPRR